MAQSSFSHFVIVPVAPRTAWRRLQDAGTWRGLGILDQVSNPVSEGGLLSSFDWSAVVGGTRHRGTAVVTANTPDRSIALSLRSSEVAGEIEVLLGEAGGDEQAATLEVRLTARPRGFLAGVFWGRIADSIGRGLPERVERLADMLAERP